MKQLFPLLRGSSNTMARSLRVCLLSSLAFILLLSTHTASAHTLTPTVPLGTVCSDFCEGGYEVYSDSSFLEAWANFQVPCTPSGTADILVRMGGDGNTVGLAAGVEATTGRASLLIESNGPGGYGFVFGSSIACGDTITAEVFSSSVAFVTDLNNGRTLIHSGGPVVYNFDAKCVVQDHSANFNLGNFGTVTFNSQCWTNDSSSGWQSFGDISGSYLWLQDNSGNTMAVDPNVSRAGLTPGAPEQVQWDAAN